MQVYDRFTVNNHDSKLASKPLPAIAKHGDFYYDSTLKPNPWTLWEGGPYNDTTATMFVDGESTGGLVLRARNCDAAGCATQKVAQADNRDGVLFWSAPETWSGANPPMEVPTEVSAAHMHRYRVSSFAKEA